jgi:tryptophanyl-tRNA synthetase
MIPVVLVGLVIIWVTIVYLGRKSVNRQYQPTNVSSRDCQDELLAKTKLLEIFKKVLQKQNNRMHQCEATIRELVAKNQLLEEEIKFLHKIQEQYDEYFNNEIDDQ